MKSLIGLFVGVFAFGITFIPEIAFFLVFGFGLILAAITINRKFQE